MKTMACTRPWQTPQVVPLPLRKPLPEHDLSAQMDLETEFGQHRGLDSTGAVGLLCIWGIDNRGGDGLMPRQHLVAGDASENRVHDWPLWSRFATAPFGFLLRQLHHLRDTQITMQPSVHDENAAPDDVAGFGNSFHRSSNKPKVHRRLPLTGSAAIAADKMCGWSSARDQEDPNVIIDAIAAEMLAPTKIVQGVLRGEAQLAPEPIRYESIQTGTFIDFVEMRKSLARKQDPGGLRSLDRRAVHVIEQALDKVAGGREVLKPLLILNANGRAAELVREADCG